MTRQKDIADSGAGSAEQVALGVVRSLQGAGHTAYFAGGCVRDRLLGGTPQDFDVATSALPPEVIKLFPRSRKVGVAFGVVLVRRKAWTVEVATFRADGTYSDGRHPDAVRFTNAQEDAQRRDFTCNALFFDPLQNVLHDFVGGQADIQSRLLRAVGDPARRFAEDHLRMLRAVRFAARLDFHIEAATHDAILHGQALIAQISRERIGEEIRMMLEHATRARAMTILGGYPALFEEVFGLAATTARWERLARLPEAVGRATALAVLLRDLNPQAPSWPPTCSARLRQRLMLTNEEVEELTFVQQSLPLLARWGELSKAALKRMIADRRWVELVLAFTAEGRSEAERRAFDERVGSLVREGVAPPPLVKGEDLIALGAQAGPTFKRWLADLYDRQLDGELKDKEQALAAARSLLK